MSWPEMWSSAGLVILVLSLAQEQRKQASRKRSLLTAYEREAAR